MNLLKFYEENLVGKSAYCGPKEQNQNFILGTLRDSCMVNVTDEDGQHLSSYMISDVFDLIMAGTWKIEGLSLPNCMYLQKIDEIENEISSILQDVKRLQRMKVQLKKRIT
ncbi:MAG: hypothetical protein GY827_04715 [Cytophagales bacterium]|nr:hypothetical protein [Cytophagales bacterium]